MSFLIPPVARSDTATMPSLTVTESQMKDIQSRAQFVPEQPIWHQNSPAQVVLSLALHFLHYGIQALVIDAAK